MPQPNTSELEKRFVDYYEVYAKGTPAMALVAQRAMTPSTPSATATKSIATRTGIHGQSTMTAAGVQSVKNQGTQRTQSQK